MAVKNKIFLPTLISSVTYQPVRTLPHIYFYNGLKDCEEYYIQHYPSGSTAFVETSVQNKFPYMDYYDGLTPSTGSNSLLFFNETPPYGVAPTASLYTEYWDKYVSLLYNPRTRLIKASAIIPLADYFEMELNDIVQFRGNYYHLRAINDYNLKDGTCKIELLGPIISDAASIQPAVDCTFNFSSSLQGTIPTTSTTTLVPTTSTTTLVSSTTTQAPTTSTTTVSCPECNSYELREQSGAEPSTWEYTNCLNGDTETIVISSQVTRTFASRTTPVKISGGNVVGPTNVYTFPAGYNCGPFDFCKTETWRVVTLDATPPGFIQVQYYNPTNCLQETTVFDSSGGTYDITVVSGSLTMGGPVGEVSSITLLSTGSSTCCLTTTTTQAPTTTTTTLVPTTTTTISTFEYSNSGRGNTVNSACSDASINNRTFYSNCSSISVGCSIYTNSGGTTPLTGYTYVFIDGAVWNINSGTGVITSYSSIQC